MYLFQNSQIFSPWGEVCRLPWFFLWACEQTKLLKKKRMELYKAQRETSPDIEDNLFLCFSTQNIMVKLWCLTYWEIFAFSPHVELEHQVKDMKCFSLTGSLVEGKDGTKLLRTSSGQNRNFGEGAFFPYLHEELWTFGHEQLNDKGRWDARDGAEDHKQPPALEFHKAQGEMGPCLWNHQPGQTCQQRHGLHQRLTFCV